MSLKKNIIITGASRGIGLGLVKNFLKSKDSIPMGSLIATYRTKESSQELFSLASDDKRLNLLELDLSQESSIQSFCKKVIDLDRSVDLLINNAGVLHDADKTFLTLDLEAVEGSFKINTLGPMYLTRGLEMALKKSSQAVVAHLSSMMGSIADNDTGGFYAYRISKCALNMFNKCYSLEFKDRISLVLHPGWVQTRMGGPDALIGIEESCSGLVKVIKTASLKESGKFIDYKGRELPW